MFRFRKPTLTADAATNRLAGNQANLLGYAHLAGPTGSPLRRGLMNVKILQVAVLTLPMSGRGDSRTGDGHGLRSGLAVVPAHR